MTTFSRVTERQKSGLVNDLWVGQGAGMTRAIFIYAGLLAAAVLVLEWIEYQYMVRMFTTEIYIILIAVAFTALGLWLGRALTPSQRSPDFVLNEAAMKSLGITRREHAVLQQMAGGHSNKQIADALNVSPNTIKTHIARLYEKLEVSQRVQAVQKAKDLELIP